MRSMPILSDAAISNSDSDKLRFDRYIDPLISVLIDKEAETPFTIGIFGPWGSGKTSLLNLIDDYLEKGHPDGFVRVHFNPWMHRNEPNMLVPLLHTLHDTLEEDRTKRFVESARRIGEVLLRLGADELLKKMTANIVSLERLEKLEQAYLKERGKVESELRKLHKSLQTVADAIEGKAKMVFFIDDLDRCDPLQIIDLLEAVKLFFDLKNVFIILAVDKEVIDRGIEVKYSKFTFGGDRQSALGAEYLEKMVQLPIQLHPLNEKQVGGFISSLRLNESVRAQSELLRNLVPHNPRKIKRILNIFMVAMGMVETTAELQTLRKEIITRLVVLQVQSGDLYADILKQNELLIALEKVFAAEIRVNNLEDYKEFGDRAEGLKKLCSKYFRPDTYLAQLFNEAHFNEIKDDLPTYLSMLGG